MIHLAFQGGTALRFLYAIPRYSEALDFALEKPGSSYDFRAYLRAIQDGLVKEGYQIGIKLNDRKTVHSGFLRFNLLLLGHAAFDSSCWARTVPGPAPMPGSHL
jgi:predicted nucleotidyltransferase component of viral defense system